MIFKIVWPVTSLIVWYAVIWNLLHRREVVFGTDAMEVTNRFGPVSRTATFSKNGITGFSHDSNMSSGNQSYYRVRAEVTQGKKITLADGITESTTAEALVGRLEEWRDKGAE